MCSECADFGLEVSDGPMQRNVSYVWQHSSKRFVRRQCNATSLHVSQNQLGWTLPLSCWNALGPGISLPQPYMTTRHSLCRGGKSDSQRTTAIFFHKRVVHMLVDPTWVAHHQKRDGKELSTTMFTSYPKIHPSVKIPATAWRQFLQYSLYAQQSSKAHFIICWYINKI